MFFVAAGVLAATATYGQATSKRGWEREIEHIDRNFSDRYSRLTEEIYRFPERADSVRRIISAELDRYACDLFQTLKPYARQQWSMECVYKVMARVPKEELREFMAGVPQQVKVGPYASSIMRHLNTEQVCEGDRYADFQAMRRGGKGFNLADELRKRDVLVIFDGLGGMGPERLGKIKDLYGTLDNSQIEFVSFMFSRSSYELEEDCTYYKVPWTMVSDCKGEHSPTKIRYGVKATPTCVLIKQDGTVELLSDGFDGDVNKALEKYRKQENIAKWTTTNNDTGSEL